MSPTLTVPGRLAERGLVVVDVEGNGQQPPEIIEIAALPLTPTVSTAEVRSWLVRPSRPITGLVTSKVHGISNDDVADAPTWTEITAPVTALLQGRVLVAHNASVERRILSAHLPDWRPPLVLDTLRLAKTVWPDLPGGHSLDNLISHADLPLPAGDRTPGEMVRHRAGFDVWMTAALLIALVEASGLDSDALVAAAEFPAPRATRVARTCNPIEGGLW